MLLEVVISHVFACFVDFTKAFDKVNYWFAKAFDKVNYWKLFNQLLDDGVSPSLVQLLGFWYSQQEVSVLCSIINSE